MIKLFISLFGIITLRHTVLWSLARDRLSISKSLWGGKYNIYAGKTRIIPLCSTKPNLYVRIEPKIFPFSLSFFCFPKLFFIRMSLVPKRNHLAAILLDGHLVHLPERRKFYHHHNHHHPQSTTTTICFFTVFGSKLTFPYHHFPPNHHDGN